MARRIRLATHLSVDELEQRYRTAHEPHECTWWQMLWLLARGQTATAIAAEPSGKFRVARRAFPLDLAKSFEGCEGVKL